MIRDQNRSGWFGASDTARVMGSWETYTFRNWWLVKLGVRQETFKTVSMQTGSALEHRILKQIGVTRMDRQIKVRDLRLRVNLDGETMDTIKEVKTYGKSPFKVSRPYWMQAQVEMFVSGKKLDLVAYRLTPDDYINWFLPIDKERLEEIPVQYDKNWIFDAYLPRLRYLAKCLVKGVWPDEIPS